MNQPRRPRKTTPNWPAQAAYFFLPAFLAAHTAFIFAESLALAAALIPPFFAGALAGALAVAPALAARTLAHRALAAARIFPIAAGLSFFLVLGASLEAAGAEL